MPSEPQGQDNTRMALRKLVYRLNPDQFVTVEVSEMRRLFSDAAHAWEVEFVKRCWERDLENLKAAHARELLEARLTQEKERDEWRHLITTVISAAKGWFHEHDMYRGAWLREMGGEIRRKAHEIDGFVLRTRDIYEGYKQVPELRKCITDLERQLAELDSN